MQRWKRKPLPPDPQPDLPTQKPPVDPVIPPPKD